MDPYNYHSTFFSQVNTQQDPSLNVFIPYYYCYFCDGVEMRPLTGPLSICHMIHE
jgi:hypothetical protein